MSKENRVSDERLADLLERDSYRMYQNVLPMELSSMLAELQSLRSKPVEAKTICEAHNAKAILSTLSLPAQKPRDVPSWRQRLEDLATEIEIGNVTAAAAIVEELMEGLGDVEEMSAIVPQPEAVITEEMGHPDDLAVDRFAAEMKAKLAKKRTEGRGGWDRKDECSAEFLSQLLREHVEKGDPVDVGNLAMMLQQRGERITK